MSILDILHVLRKDTFNKGDVFKAKLHATQMGQNCSRRTLPLVFVGKCPFVNPGKSRDPGNRHLPNTYLIYLNDTFLQKDCKNFLHCQLIQAAKGQHANICEQIW
jgi:hypothetical protein